MSVSIRIRFTFTKNMVYFLLVMCMMISDMMDEFSRKESDEVPIVNSIEFPEDDEILRTSEKIIDENIESYIKLANE